HSNVLEEALAASASQAEQLMSATSSRILTDANEALGRLNQSNTILQQVLESANTSLAQLETSVASQTAAYAATVQDAVGSTQQAGELVASQVTALQQTVRGMIDDFGSMMGSLHSEVAVIDQSAAALNQAGTQSIEALEARGAAMDILAQSFATRADEIDGRMRTFAQTIADSVNETERRLIDARAQMESIVSGSSQQVEAALAVQHETGGTFGDDEAELIGHPTAGGAGGGDRELGVGADRRQEAAHTRTVPRGCRTVVVWGWRR
ncbi:MAG: hypothetical protein ABMA25_05475, partial [Ilumatobacteraceae bacterium]